MHFASCWCNNCWPILPGGAKFTTTGERRQVRDYVSMVSIFKTPVDGCFCAAGCSMDWRLGGSLSTTEKLPAPFRFLSVVMMVWQWTVRV